MKNNAKTWPNLVTMFFDQVEQSGDNPFLWSKQNGTYVPQSWSETAKQVRELACGLKSTGVKKGSRVLLVSENRPEWLIADIAIMAIGAITVPAYITNTETDHLHIIENSGAELAIVSNTKLTERVLPAALKSGGLKDIVTMEMSETVQNENIKIPSIIEVTFLRKDKIKILKNNKKIKLPHTLDIKNDEFLKDVVMPKIWWKK